MHNTTCDETGKCSCKSEYTGAKCNECLKGYFKTSYGTCKGMNLLSNLQFNSLKNTSCLECDCDMDGSVDNACNARGECTCKQSLIGGPKCHKCADYNYFNFPNCKRR